MGLLRVYNKKLKMNQAQRPQRYKECYFFLNNYCHIMDLLGLFFFSQSFISIVQEV